jgi:hypothetical protein
MTNIKHLAMAVVAAAVTVACSSKDTLLSTHDGAAGSPSGSGGSVTSSGGTPGLGGALGLGGATGLGGTAGGGTGGLPAGTGGATAIDSGGSGGTTVTKDGGVGGGVDSGGLIDASVDLSGRRDAADGGTECEPGYPVGSTKPAGDGCNTCTCLASGAFICTMMACPAPDAAIDSASCPAGQMWCPGCTPGTGSCGVACTGMVCPTDAAVTADTGAGACSQATNQADCDSRADCHSVFYDPGTCGCASPGCCAHFSKCAEGAKAACVSPTPGTGFCDMATPFCESPYVISYTSYCYEGCVPSSECGP